MNQKEKYHKMGTKPTIELKRGVMEEQGKQLKPQPLLRLLRTPLPETQKV